MTREEFQVIYDQGPDAVYDLFDRLSNGLEFQIAVLEARIRQLEGQINTNSKNSGKPPSSDGLAKPQSLRKKSGGQKGHPGHTLEMTAHPDKIVTHTVEQCQHCGTSLANRPVESVERRQVFDIPPLKPEVTEHQVEHKSCPECHARNKASFPEGITQPVQYGPEIKALAVYLNQGHFIPYDRVEEILRDLFGQSFSEGSLFAANQACYEATEGVEQIIKQQIINSPVINCDETGARVEGKTRWLHTAGNQYLTYYGIHPKRGSIAMDDLGILPFYKGIAKHDGLSSYFKYIDCLHSLCNVHHLRELVWVIENEHQIWAGQMKELLLEILAAVDDAKDNSKTCLGLEQLIDFETRYSSAIALGYHENPCFEVWPRPKNERGRPKRTKARNLLERLDRHRIETLNFMYDFRIPFGNNQAEQDIRMAKVQQKVSGGFRSFQGAGIFCRIRGYISTVRKNSVPVLGAIRDALLGNPFVPDCM